MCQKKTDKNLCSVRYNMLKGWWQIVHSDIEYEKWFPQRFDPIADAKGSFSAGYEPVHRAEYGLYQQH